LWLNLMTRLRVEACGLEPETDPLGKSHYFHAPN
jgi:hypothetical protein